jgi:Flp pilus assembly protein TadD
LLAILAAEVTLPPRSSGKTDRDVAALRLVDQLQRALHRRDRAEIVDRLQELVAVRAPMARQWLQLALIAADLGEVRLARQAVDLFVEQLGGEPAALFSKVGVLKYLGAYDEALALMQTLPPSVPDEFSYALSRGTLTISTGAISEARSWLEQALRLRRQSGEAWHSLAMLVDFAGEPDLAERIIGSERLMYGAPRTERAYF